MFVGVAIMWVGYTCTWWGYGRLRGPVSLLDLIVPGRTPTFGPAAPPPGVLQGNGIGGAIASGAAAAPPAPPFPPVPVF